MEWIPVESSQIACIGYEISAEYPLGVKFKPNRRQTEAGQPGSVYEYANVSLKMFADFLGAKDNYEYGSIGKFFDQVIKAHPEQYPFRRLEMTVDMGPVTSAADEL